MFKVSLNKLYFVKSLNFLCALVRHTTETENFNSTHLSFVLKKTAYAFEAMEARTMLTVIDYNHGVTRPYLTNAQGEPLLKRRQQKRSKKFVVGPVREPKNYRFVCNGVV